MVTQDLEAEPDAGEELDSCARGVFSAPSGPFTSLPIQLRRRLPLLTDALERLVVGFLVHEAASFGVTLGPALISGVADLTAFAYGSLSMTIAGRRICCHPKSPV